MEVLRACSSYRPRLRPLRFEPLCQGSTDCVATRLCSPRDGTHARRNSPDTLCEHLFVAAGARPRAPAEEDDLHGGGQKAKGQGQRELLDAIEGGPDLLRLPAEPAPAPPPPPCPPGWGPRAHRGAGKRGE